MTVTDQTEHNLGTALRSIHEGGYARSGSGRHPARASSGGDPRRPRHARRAAAGPRRTDVGRDVSCHTAVFARGLAVGVPGTVRVHANSGPRRHADRGRETTVPTQSSSILAQTPTQRRNLAVSVSNISTRVDTGWSRYLDGAWDARCVTPPPPPPSRNGSCAFEANVDFDVANVSHVGMMSARDQAECCFRCWNRAGCAAAVRSSLWSALAAGLLQVGLSIFDTANRWPRRRCCRCL